MSSIYTSDRPSEFISIPVNIIPDSNSMNSRYNPSLQPIRNNNSYSDFSSLSSGEKPTINSYYTSRFRQRPSATSGYDRLIRKSHNDRQTYKPNLLHTSHSNDDLLSSKNDSIHSQNIPFNSSIYNNDFRSNPDFIHPNKHTNLYSRPYNEVNGFSDTQQRQSYINSNEYDVPINRYQSNPYQQTNNNCK